MVLRHLPNVRSLKELSRHQRLLVLYTLGLVGIILFYTVVYNTGMRTLEGESHSIFRSFQTVVETMTTTGYGADSPWLTPWMNLLVVLMQLSGIAIGFFTLRLLVIPLFERTSINLENRLTAKDDHVVICEYRRDSDILLDELERLDIDYVLIDSDEEEATRLSNTGYQAISGDPEEVETLERAMIDDAALVITDAGDRNASIVLTALDLNEDLRLVSLTESARQHRALTEIGVDTVISPHSLIGRRLAHKATAAVTVPEGTAVGEDIEIREVLVRHGSPFHDTEVRETPFFEHPQLTLIAGWFKGDLRLPPSPTDRLTRSTVLVVAGPSDVIDEVREEVSGVRSVREHTNVIVAGMGEGGRAAINALSGDVSITTIDLNEDEAVDVVGDSSDPETLAAAGIEDATALIVTVDDDAIALLTIALARSLTDEIEILVRVTSNEKVRTAFSAGADYVLSIQQATARLLAREIYGEDIVSPLSQIRLVRTDAAPFAGQSLKEANEGAETGWVLVGVERDGTLRTEATTQIDGGDKVLVAGTDVMIQEFEEETTRS
ncbi:potassium channel family protein [Halalkalicoccus sp. GCM10025322]|uniref:potassium channel family protein n=1 Tax=Halalkalicoccus TaxID=332246 RepID=UPI00360F35A0